MMEVALSLDTYKKAAALEAAKLVQDGMRLGLGTGSTADHFTRAVADRVKQGLSVTCIGTSQRTETLASELGLTLGTFEEIECLDLTVDGADEVDPSLNLIKGGGGAHLREKIVATNSNRLVIIADHTKAVDCLGAFPLPLEVVPFALAATRRQVQQVLESSGIVDAALSLRQTSDGCDFRTDCDNLILDCACGEISDPKGLATLLSSVPGIVEHGLFIGLASEVILAGPDGTSRLSRDAR